MTQGVPKSVPDMENALAEIRELRELSLLTKFDLRQFLDEFRKRGTPILRADIDPAPAVGTKDYIVHYKLADGVLACLQALRVQAGKVEKIGVGMGSGKFVLGDL
jgi:hypothetical protein